MCGDSRKRNPYGMFCLLIDDLAVSQILPQNFPECFLGKRRTAVVSRSSALAVAENSVLWLNGFFTCAL